MLFMERDVFHETQKEAASVPRSVIALPGVFSLGHFIDWIDWLVYRYASTLYNPNCHIECAYIKHLLQKDLLQTAMQRQGSDKCQAM